MRPTCDCLGYWVRPNVNDGSLSSSLHLVVTLVSVNHAGAAGSIPRVCSNHLRQPNVTCACQQSRAATHTRETGPSRETRQPKLGSWLDFEKIVNSGGQYWRTDEVVVTMVPLLAKSLPWRPWEIWTHSFLSQQQRSVWLAVKSEWGLKTSNFPLF